MRWFQQAPVPLRLTLRDREAVVSKGEARAQVFQKPPYAIALHCGGTGVQHARVARRERDVPIQDEMLAAECG